MLNLHFFFQWLNGKESVKCQNSDLLEGSLVKYETWKHPVSMLPQIAQRVLGSPMLAAAQCSQGPIASMQTFHVPYGRRGTWLCMFPGNEQSSGTLVFSLWYCIFP